jgi:type IV secretion system protein VirB6
MSGCPSFSAGGPLGIADALSKVDCLAADATTLSFGRLFGDNGAFRTALTIILTLYVAFLAVNLLTGRSTLRLSTLTPRMMTMGLVITFVTSWIAYQSVIWNLAVGAPDQIASVLVGTKGSATMVFAQRLDFFFNAISDAAAAIPSAPRGTVAAAPTAAFASPGNILSIAALLLLLGTVGVLVACRLALAALLILGPIFIVLALFQSTRGLFEGWLKSVAMFAFVPLLTVLLGSGALLALDPMIADLGGGGEITLRAAVTILFAAIIYLALMALAFKTAGTLTSGWRLGKTHSQPAGFAANIGTDGRSLVTRPVQAATPAIPPASDRVRSTVSGLDARSTIDRSTVSRITTSATADTVPALAGPTSVMTGFRHDPYIRHRLQSSPRKLQGMLQ